MARAASIRAESGAVAPSKRQTLLLAGRLQPRLEPAALHGRGVLAHLQAPGLRFPFARRKPQTEPVQRLGVIQLIRRGDRLLEPRLKLDPRHLLDGLLELLRCEPLVAGISLVG